jgi:flap endonuclease-1
MGIKHLNRYLRENCSSSIRLSPITVMTGKKIVVDISIYMYKYEAEGSLLENIYLMLAVFRKHQIIPIFIFDGKPPNEKKELLLKRRQDKKEAEQEYKKLKVQLDSNENMELEDKRELMNHMDILKKQFITLNKEKIDMVKKMINAYGATYYDALGEADELCAALVIKNKVWACLSEDMDLFVYGCPRVIRYLSLLNHTAVLYDLKGILCELDISQKELREICVLSGTDYHINLTVEQKNENNLLKTLKMFTKYKKQKENTNNSDFYEWLRVQDNDSKHDVELLMKITDMFDLTKNQSLNELMKHFEPICFQNGPIVKEEIIELLKKDGFIFPSTT